MVIELSENPNIINVISVRQQFNPSENESNDVEYHRPPISTLMF